MEKQIRSFYYIGLEDLKDSKTEKKEKYRTRKQQNPIPVYRVEKKLFFGKEELVLYFSLLPTGFREEIRKKRKRKQWEEKILQAVSYAENALFCRGYEVLFGKGIGTEQEIPAELFGACLTENPCGYAGELSQLSLSLPADGGSSVTEKAMFLLTPFLSGINRVIFAGEETDNSQQIEDFLFLNTES